MKNPDEAIERVLAGLRDCQPGIGMEDRILQAMHDDAAKRSALGWPSLMRSPFAAAISWSCAAALLGLFAVLLSIQVSTKPPAHLAKGLRANSVPTIEPAVAARPPRPHLDERTAGAKRKTPVRRANLRHRESSSGHSSQLASHPAPPLPLTRQEQLLLQIAHRIDPKQLAMFNPTQQALQNAKEKKEFQEFFGPTTMRGDE